MEKTPNHVEDKFQSSSISKLADLKNETYTLLIRAAFGKISQEEKIKVDSIFENPLEKLSYSIILEEKSNFSSYQDYIKWLDEKDQESWKQIKELIKQKK